MIWNPFSPSKQRETRQNPHKLMPNVLKLHEPGSTMVNKLRSYCPCLWGSADLSRRKGFPSDIFTLKLLANLDYLILSVGTMSCATYLHLHLKAWILCSLHDGHKPFALCHGQFKFLKAPYSALSHLFILSWHNPIHNFSFYYHLKCDKMQISSPSQSSPPSIYTILRLPQNPSWHLKCTRGLPHPSSHSWFHQQNWPHSAGF